MVQPEFLTTIFSEDINCLDMVVSPPVGLIYYYHKIG